MKFRNSVIAGLVAASLLLPGCENQTAAVSKPDDRILNAFQETLVAKTNDFGFNLYRELDSGDENIMISPVSVAMALSMADNGARGETQKAIAAVLKTNDVDIDTVNANNLALLYYLSNADPQVRLSIANSLWLNQEDSFAANFTDRAKSFYHATAQELDFGKADAAAVINQWVKKKTQGLIDEIVAPPVDPDSVLYLINAVYFKGEWTQPFDTERTVTQTFFVNDQQTVTVPMMYQSGVFDYYRGQGFQALRLPYGQEERLAMMLFLPDEESSLTQFQSQLNSENWAAWLAAGEKKQGTVSLPRFSLTYETSLNPALKNLGMGIAFDADRADFSGMVSGASKQPLFISEVKHKTCLQVDETGTAAAAVTATGMTATSLPEYEFELNFNRPFFYAIQDSQTGALLFIGCLVNPSSSDVKQ